MKNGVGRDNGRKMLSREERRERVLNLQVSQSVVGDVREVLPRLSDVSVMSYCDPVSELKDEKLHISDMDELCMH